MDHGDKSGPAIFSSKDLSLVYADIKRNTTFDTRVQMGNGGRYLAFIESGRYHAFDANYQKKWTVSTRDLRAADANIHDCEFISQGNALMTTYQTSGTTRLLSAER
ncbi:hypothetical protein NW768_009180 [Fusarium equiseti]|uniref:Uncharacterized protein n=1 Tax=Fusarium equiseti TaxID=61235 RepID=A0ABQ8R4M7_FUSEQ|nr:hypothetical protein NW768_009180 [Fusarium equiseti]